MFLKYIILPGPDEADRKLDGFIQIVKEMRQSEAMSHKVDEFKTIFKYLAFVACAAKAPIRQKLLDETLN